VDTKFLSDDELQNMVKQNPNTCLKIDLNQNKLYGQMRKIKKPSLPRRLL
jgi:hypothetical protein